MASKSKYIDEQMIHEILKPYAYKVFKDLSLVTHRAIDEFYGGYQPEMYQRTFGMKNLFTPEMIQIDNGYRIEFTYATENLTTEHRSNEAVYVGSFQEGWHGGQYAWGRLKPKVPRMTPSPWRLIEDYVRTYKI